MAHNPEVIFIPGGGLINDNGRWRTTNFDEGDNFGAMGDRLRVEAAYILYKKNPGLLLITLGGQGQYKDIPGVPTVAEVIKRELMDLGVPESSINKEEQSGNTWQQLQALKALIKKEKLNAITILSNRYHLPRVRTMVEHDGKLRTLLAEEKLTLTSAEEILIAQNPTKWQELVTKAYQTEAMKKRIAKEEEGVRQIEEGTYKPQ